MNYNAIGTYKTFEWLCKYKETCLLIYYNNIIIHYLLFMYTVEYPLKKYFNFSYLLTGTRSKMYGGRGQRYYIDLTVVNILIRVLSRNSYTYSILAI